MSKHDFERFEYLSNQAISGSLTEVELKELQQLMDLWSLSVRSKEQLSSVHSKTLKK